MRLYPAIDILGGNAVRLIRGDFAAKTVYDQDPLSAARSWTQAGARQLHVIDLDGAKAGEPANLAQLQRIVGELGVPVQYGGGLRTLPAVEAALRAGAERVILGTAAFTEPDLLRRALKEHGPDRVLVSVDVRGGSVTTAGWTESTGLGAVEVVQRLQADGVRHLVYTDVDRDGMLEGPDLDEVCVLAGAVGGTLLYSGGIGSLDDLRRLADLRAPSLEGVIVGKALYEGRFTIADAHAALDA